MIISDLNHLETISEAPSVVGGMSIDQLFQLYLQKADLVMRQGGTALFTASGSDKNGDSFTFASTVIASRYSLAAS